MFRVLLIVVAGVHFLSGVGYATISTMKLLGKGEFHYLGFIKVYDAALYVDGEIPEQGILAADVSRCLQLTYEVSLEVKDFVLAAETVLSRQHSPEKIAELRKEIDTLHAAYKDVKQGDSYFLCYSAATQQTTLTLNSTELVAVTSADLAAAYFGIWLGETKPVDEQLRAGLLPETRKMAAN